MWNRLIYAVESRLRRSSVGQQVRGLAMRYHMLHRLLLWSRELSAPYQGAVELSRYQARAVHKFSSMAGDGHLPGIILEVGSDDQGAVAAQLLANGADRVVGINPSGTVWQSAQRASAILLLRADARAVPAADGSFDAIFSVATFEHINNLGLAMDEFFRVLRPGGMLFCDFGPIWSSRIGHHVYAKVGEQEARHWKPGLNPVPDFGHLLFSPGELGNILLQKCSQELTEAIIEWIYHAPDINRLFFEDYLGIFRRSRFEVESLVEVTDQVRPQDLASLQAKHPAYQRFDCRMVEAVFRKASGLNSTES